MPPFLCTTLTESKVGRECSFEYSISLEHTPPPYPVICNVTCEVHNHDNGHGSFAERVLQKTSGTCFDTKSRGIMTKEFASLVVTGDCYVCTCL